MLLCCIKAQKKSNFLIQSIYQERDEGIIIKKEKKIGFRQPIFIYFVRGE